MFSFSFLFFNPFSNPPEHHRIEEKVAWKFLNVEMTIGKKPVKFLRVKVCEAMHFIHLKFNFEPRLILNFAFFICRAD